MEPALSGSWRCETLATANEISPPISPVPSSSPASPTLYSSSYIKPGDDLLNELLFDIGNNSDLLSDSDIVINGEINGNCDSPFISSEGEALLIAAPSSIGGFSQAYTSQLPRLSSSPVDRTLNISPALSRDDYWTEESEPSLNLVELLEFDEAHVSPLIDDVKPQAPLGSGIRQLVNLPAPDITTGALSASVNSSEKGEIDADAKFQEILQSLNLDHTRVADIPSEVIDVSELRDVGIEIDSISSQDSPMDEDEDSMSSSSSSVGSPSVDGQEIIVYTTDDSQSQSIMLENSFRLDDGSNIFLAVSQSSSLSGSDLEDETQEMVVDSLLQHEFGTAGQLVTRLNQPAGRFGSSAGHSKSEAILRMTIKPERRGRKPSSANVDGKPWVHVTDKAQRKKEQNKTAATRYRQKKKLEAELCMMKEQELSQKHDALAKEREDLAKELNFVKQLLRECLAKKKAGASRR